MLVFKVSCLLYVLARTCILPQLLSLPQNPSECLVFRVNDLALFSSESCRKFSSPETSSTGSTTAPTGQYCRSVWGKQVVLVTLLCKLFHLFSFHLPPTQVALYILSSLCRSQLTKENRQIHTSTW